MRIGAFEISEPLPELRDPVVITSLQPWIDVNNVATSILRDLETQLGGIELAKLAKPGLFFDFTRYRPHLYFDQGIRRVRIPNTNPELCQEGNGERPSFSPSPRTSFSVRVLR